MLIEGGDYERAFQVADEMFVQGMRKAESFLLQPRLARLSRRWTRATGL